MKYSFLFILLTFSTTVFAQTDSVWKHSLVAGLTMTQVSFTDWAQGGENALSYTFSADGKSEIDATDWDWLNAYQFAFGQTRLGDQELRKTDDKIDISSVLTWKLSSFINPYVSATLKTQFGKGFLYDATGNKTEVSNFFDPGYLTQSAGAGYQPVKEIKTRLGLALREILTNQFNQYADDPATVNVEKISLDGGFESVTNLDWQLEDNLLLASQLEMFAPFKTLDEVVVRNTSSLTAKVGKYVTAILSVQLINEKKVTPRTQVKETMSLGLSYTVF
jgi:hypothetical protein